MKNAVKLPSEPVATTPQGCTNLKLRQLMRKVAQHYDAEMATAGLKATQYSLLSYVVKLGPIQPSALAEAMKMDASTLTRNLRPLIAAGWLEVGPGDDGRSRRVQATAAGKDKRREAQRRWRSAQEGMNHLLGDETVVALHALMDHCMRRLDDVSAHPSGG